ncbi:MAG: hypothetical protein U5K30_11145 [Acidimicrobiales bacterium]|nr:hypothetical protein [Acidimicrobiales bacterium]
MGDLLVITDRTLAQLRTSAALALLLPGMSVDVRVGDETVVHATRMPFPDADHPILPVCAFHRSVVRALDLRKNGTRVQMVGIAGDLEPDVELVPGEHIRIVPGGVVRFESESWFHFCTLSLPVERVEPVARVVAADTGVVVDLHADRSLDVTVAVTDTPSGDVGATRDAIDALERVAAAATVDALVDLVQPDDTDWEALLTPRRR